MGRAFEYRKARKMKRWGNMARTFTKLGKEITIAEREEVNTLIDKIEDDDDVQNVFSDMAEDEE